MLVQIALHRGKGIVGRLIRWQSRADYSHASLVLPSGAVIESREGCGVRLLAKGLQPARGEVIDLFTVPMTAAQVEMIVTFACRQIGKRYDWPMVWGFVSRSETEGQESGGKWFCSELVYAAFAQAGIRLLRGIEPWEVSPGLLSYSPLLQVGAIVRQYKEEAA